MGHSLCERSAAIQFPVAEDSRASRAWATEVVSSVFAPGVLLRFGIVVGAEALTAMDGR